MSKHEGKPGEPAAYWVAVDECMRWVDNPRKNNEAVEDCMRSIKRFGFGAPLVRRKANGEIIAGDTRIQAARRLGMKTVPVRDMDLTEEEAHMLARADNKTAERARWDPDKLLEQLRRDYDSGGAEALLDQGFSEAEYAELFIGHADESLAPSFDDGTPFGDFSGTAPVDDGFVGFKFGDHGGRVSRKVYALFVERYRALQQQSGSVMLDDVLREWLDV